MENISQLPETIETKLIIKTQLFEIEALQVRFSNGVERTLERLRDNWPATVLIVPFSDAENILLIREYSAGTNQYELVFPTGRLNLRESIKDAANRELKEEVGFGANSLTIVKTLLVSPGHSNNKTHIVMAEELYEEKLSGDEPEPVQAFSWPIAKIDELIHSCDFNEARSVAALLLVKSFVEKREC
jgi:ADP-ribose diphosphatase